MNRISVNAFLVSIVLAYAPTSLALEVKQCFTEECQAYFKKWKVMAAAKRPSAMSAVGEFYYAGYGTQRNIEQSLRYFKKAARYRVANAEFRAGYIYLTENNYLDKNKGIKFLKRAARQGHVESSYLLGVIYSDAHYGVKNTLESDKWLSKALNDNHPKARGFVDNLNQLLLINKTDYPTVNEILLDSQTHFSAKNSDSYRDSNGKLSAKIDWPVENGTEIISVNGPNLHEYFDSQLEFLRTTSSSNLSATGSKIVGKSCADVNGCSTTSKADFERLIIQNLQ